MLLQSRVHIPINQETKNHCLGLKCRLTSNSCTINNYTDSLFRIIYKKYTFAIYLAKAPGSLISSDSLDILLLDKL